MTNAGAPFRELLPLYVNKSLRVNMADSLSPECTPLKVQYDTCFNSWFEGYLEPAVSTSPAERSAYSKRKADEFQKNCGGIWEEYRKCVQVGQHPLKPRIID